MEYDALGESFTNRGARSEEQIDVMRKLWADEVISYDGKWHNITEAGLNPLPARQIPIWLGGMAEKVIDRVGRIGDGWFPFFNPNLQGQLEQLHAAAKRHGRDPNEIGIEVMTPLRDASDKQLDQLKKLRDMGVTHSAVVTMSAGLQKEEHIDAIKRFWDAAGSITD